MESASNHGTLSLWYADKAEAEAGRTPLVRDSTADVCIIGAGIAGLAVAYQLALEGRKVVVIDDGLIGGGETGRSTAHLASAVDDRFYRIESVHGARAAQLCYESHAAAIDWYEATAAREDIKCDFERLDGYLFLPPGESRDLIDREFEAARRAGVRGVRPLARAPLSAFDTGPCICFPRQGQIDPLAFLLGLAKAIERHGGRIHCRTSATQIEDKNGLSVRCANGVRIRAESVVVATNSPINTMLAMHTKQHAYRTYAIALPLTPGAMPPALFWDTSQTAGESGAYHYVRLQRRTQAVENGHAGGEEILIVGGEDHKTGQADDAQQRWGRLEEWAIERFPVAGPARFHWSGQVMEPVDGLAFIGRSPGGPEGVFVVTGDSGQGMTHSGIAGMLLGDLIHGRPNEWADLYEPSRKSLRTIGEYTRENLNMAAQYFDWLRPGDVESVEEIAAGEGALVRKGLKMLACYRDDTGALHECSATCPHLGGIVQWNSAESTWDCPCHGSRFDAYGKVLNGPANSPLAPADAMEAEKEHPKAEATTGGNRR
ncbi:MAG TPA: FAD-dependent oxidoreductase [Phycisphaerae bacterium]|nr:FAD-dependent oxidoreductase [Phycisphaerae bacterium]